MSSTSASMNMNTNSTVFTQWQPQPQSLPFQPRCAICVVAAIKSQKAKKKPMFTYRMATTVVNGTTVCDEHAAELLHLIEEEP